MKAPKPVEKTNLHPRNAHRFGYDFAELAAVSPMLINFIIKNPANQDTIDFSNPAAVRELNRALLLQHYGIRNWDIPPHYLCPPIPGRADYIHHIADLLADSNKGDLPKGQSVMGLDIGVGANCIYPILGHVSYGWSFVGTDIEQAAMDNCIRIIENNPQLAEAISLQQQPDSRAIFKDIIRREDKFAFTICNPPFHSSAEEATKTASRKTRNLNTNERLNFGGQSSELWCDGGEIGFITQMIYESAKYPMQVLWFTTLVSKNANLKQIYRVLNKINVATVQTIEMGQGQKISRFVAWTFQSDAQRMEWKFQ
ncbi:MAG TPA: 23S rRNA (adenine(1618)-N(6))-methyltransferase RlmF [Flavobacterium sp.]|jgi:23S rRNA (adenine1618-N6)-methyltransferase